MRFDSYVRALKAAGEPTRLRLLQLCARGELAVGDLVAVLGQSQPRVSRHLKVLCDAGLLERRRDGSWVYFRTPLVGQFADIVHSFLEPIAEGSGVIADDQSRLEAYLGEQQSDSVDPRLRRFNGLLLSYFVAQPVGDLLDVGVGSGAVLKLFAHRASTAVGIDTDLEVRREARREMVRSGLPNCTIRDGDMYAIQAETASFDTVVLDEVLLQAEKPQAALTEVLRVLRPGGRLLIVEHIQRAQIADAIDQLGVLALAAQLQIPAFRRTADRHYEYLVAEAAPAGSREARRTA